MPQGLQCGFQILHHFVHCGARRVPDSDLGCLIMPFYSTDEIVQCFGSGLTKGCQAQRRKTLAYWIWRNNAPLKKAYKTKHQFEFVTTKFSKKLAYNIAIWIKLLTYDVRAQLGDCNCSTEYHMPVWIRRNALGFTNKRCDMESLYRNFWNCLEINKEPWPTNHISSQLGELFSIPPTRRKLAAHRGNWVNQNGYNEYTYLVEM